MAISSPSSGPASLSRPSSTPPSLDSLLEEFTYLAAREKAIQARRSEIAELLDQMVEAGEADEQLSWNDCKITRRSRKSITYPDYITEQREQLKASERLSLALGEASVTIKHFWEVRGA